MLTTAVKTGKLKFHKAGSLQADYTKTTSWSVQEQTAEGTVSYTNCVNIMFQIKTHQTWVSFYSFWLTKGRELWLELLDDSRWREIETVSLQSCWNADHADCRLQTVQTMQTCADHADCADWVLFFFKCTLIFYQEGKLFLSVTVLCCRDYLNFFSRRSFFRLSDLK